MCDGFRTASAVNLHSSAELDLGAEENRLTSQFKLDEVPGCC